MGYCTLAGLEWLVSLVFTTDLFEACVIQELNTGVVMRRQAWRVAQSGDSLFKSRGRVLLEIEWLHFIWRDLRASKLRIVLEDNSRRFVSCFALGRPLLGGVQGILDRLLNLSGVDRQVTRVVHVVVIHKSLCSVKSLVLLLGFNPVFEFAVLLS